MDELTFLGLNVKPTMLFLPLACTNADSMAMYNCPIPCTPEFSSSSCKKVKLM